MKGKEVMMFGNNRDQTPKRCPRCESMNTKFCYFNNYSQSQPRHFCKACRRYWTEGGTLRNVPQGGGSYRKGKRGARKTSAQPDPTTSHATARDVVGPMPPPQAPPPPPFFVGGGAMGIDMAALWADFGGLPAVEQAPFNPPPMLPAFLNLQPAICGPLFEPSLMIQSPRLTVTSHQQMNISVFTSTTTSPAVTAAGSANGEGFWNEFNNGGGEASGALPPT